MHILENVKAIKEFLGSQGKLDEVVAWMRAEGIHRITIRDTIDGAESEIRWWTPNSRRRAQRKVNDKK